MASQIARPGCARSAYCCHSLDADFVRQVCRSVRRWLIAVVEALGGLMEK